MREIKNERLHLAFIIGAKSVMDNRLLLNQINVFPVPDGDTGNNLYSMMDSIIAHSEVKDSIKDTLESIAESAILGARGNSGVIFAQYIQGLNVLDFQPDSITLENFIRAAQNAASYAYRAVESPVEGTILTTMRVFYESLQKHNDSKISFIEVMERAYLQVEDSVSRTTEQLVNLKRASVVDSGAKGFAFFIRGFIDGLKSTILDLDKDSVIEEFEVFAEHDNHISSEPPRYRYCTEALIYNDTYDSNQLKMILSDYGDHVVVSVGQRYSRIHVHTNSPSEVFRKLTEKFKIRDQKVDDMLLQYNHLYQKKYKTVIVTDSIADLPQSIIDDGQVVVIPLDIIIGDQQFMDGLTMDNDMLFDLEKILGSHPTSSQPNSVKVEKILTDLLKIYEDIVVITVSKEMSGTYNIVKAAATSFSNRIQVIDSKQNSVAEGLLVSKAIGLLKKGYNAGQIRDYIEKLIPKSKILVSVKNLDNMVASGRLNGYVVKILKVVGLYPIISINSYGFGVVDKIVWGINTRKRDC